MAYERRLFYMLFATEDQEEGMQAFVEKRPADYLKLRELAAAGKSSEFKWGPYAQSCSSCGATALPAEFSFCGVCGASLEVVQK